MFYYAFEVLYWCGLREGGLALTLENINIENGQISVTKTYHRNKRADVLGREKSDRSIRVVTMPNFLIQGLHIYLERTQVRGGRISAYTKGSLRRVMKRCTEKDGVKDIRVYDFRYSHVSLCLYPGYSVFVIGERVGHKSEKITLYYRHLLPGVKEEIEMRLDGERYKDSM